MAKKYIVVACEVLFREISFAAARSKNIVDTVFVRRELHNIGADKMLKGLQEEIDKVNTEKYDGILLGYGLCNNGIVGIKSSLPIVIPRAHDCITLFLGSKEKYAEYHSYQPDSYFITPGWYERGNSPEDELKKTLEQFEINSYEELLEKYGQDAATYLMETLGGGLQNYSRYTYINSNIGDFEGYKNITKQNALNRKWEYEELDGDNNLFFKLIDGEWNEDEFLIIPPENTVKPSYDEKIIKIK